MAFSDAAVAVFDTKYKYNFWRPETAIRQGNMDDNPRTDADPSFMPLVITPCFPSYPSAHATLSYAAREVLEQLYATRRREEGDDQGRRVGEWVVKHSLTSARGCNCGNR